MDPTFFFRTPSAIVFIRGREHELVTCRSSLAIGTHELLPAMPLGLGSWPELKRIPMPWVALAMSEHQRMTLDSESNSGCANLMILLPRAVFSLNTRPNTYAYIPECDTYECSGLGPQIRDSDSSVACCSSKTSYKYVLCSHNRTSIRQNGASETEK